MRWTSLVALGALAASVTAQDSGAVFARQNESYAEPSGAYSVAPLPEASSSASPEPSPEPSPSPEPQPSSGPAATPSASATKEPVAEPASSVEAQPAPTTTSADKQTPDYGTNTDDCSHWASKCPWGKTVTVTEKQISTVTEKQISTLTVEKPIVSTLTIVSKETVYTTQAFTTTDYETKTIVKVSSYPVTTTVALCDPIDAPGPTTSAVPTYGGGYGRKRTPQQVCRTTTTTIWKTSTTKVTELVPVPTTIVQTQKQTIQLPPSISIETQKETIRLPPSIETQEVTRTQEVTATKIHTSVSTFLSTVISTRLIPTTVISSTTFYVTTTYTTVETYTKDVYSTIYETRERTATVTQEPETRTAIRTSVVYKPTTVVSSYIFTTSIPYTITLDHTTTTTAYSVSTYSSFITYTTYVTSPPEISYITRTSPPETITRPAETLPPVTLPPITLPGETSITTIFVEKTLYETLVVSKSYPFTITNDRTFYSTIVESSTRTIVTEVPVISYVTRTATLPPSVITLPGSTIYSTFAGEVVTLSIPGPTLTLVTTQEVTLPASTRTLPASTVVTTIVETAPASTLTITRDGSTVISIEPGPTSFVVSTLTLPPIVVTLPPTTTEVTACPAPTNAPGLTSAAEYNPKSNLTWGCQPGYVCNPPKPAGCNLWADPPADDYVCAPQNCIPAPPVTLANWKENETSYYPVNEGYFNLNPNAFGLPFDIFEYEVIVSKVKGKKGHKKTTITTGNWASATELTHFPPTAQPTITSSPAPTSSAEIGKHAYKHKQEGKTYERRAFIGKRDVTIAPAICFDNCNNVYIEVQTVGKNPQICLAGSAFQMNLETCRQCVIDNADDGKETLRLYIEPQFQQWLVYCTGEAPQTSSSATVLPPQSQASGTATLTTASQGAGSSDTSAVPIPGSTTTTTAEVSTTITSTPTPTPSPSTSVAASSTPSTASTAESSQSPSSSSPSASPTPSDTTSAATISSGTTAVTSSLSTATSAAISTGSTTAETPSPTGGVSSGSPSASSASGTSIASSSANGSSAASETSAPASASSPSTANSSSASSAPSGTPTSGAGSSPSASSSSESASAGPTTSAGSASTATGGAGGSTSEASAPFSTVSSPSTTSTGPVTAAAVKPATSTILAILAPLMVLLL
ncbi:glycoprotein X [Colletotrichum fioriniae PJ7]|uniref:Glycoprotein X n=1 Tax=Colletotrichum fioriniae PJ7 TaxID=1445577 RepID=A0A010RGT9_9PEZI|nr:glycoprotein X [Colletotrichum fioriniae PJ7]